MTRYVVIAEPITAQEEEQLVASLGAAEVAWWHWVGTGWLIADYNSRDLAYWFDRLRGCIRSIEGRSIYRRSFDLSKN